MTNLHYKRTLDLGPLLKKKSHFLFGPRATGKSSLIADTLGKECCIIDLLDSDFYIPISQSPARLIEYIDPSKEIIVIDEIQRVPELLNEVHRLIANEKYKFLLTGSSARKLKRGQSNMLAGRAWSAELFPLTSHEITDFNLDKYLRYGGLPSVYTSDDPHDELKAYVKTYLHEEIQAEAIVRKINNFNRFLTNSALSSGQILNFENVAQDAQISASTVREYFYVLQDTLIGFLVTPWLKSKKRKAIATAKFYFFDTGVVHTLTQTKTLDRNSDLYGKSFEQFIAMELRAYLSYFKKDLSLSFWRSTHNHEVDFILGDEVAIEVKSTKLVINDDLKGLRALREENKISKYYLVCQEPKGRVVDGIHIVPWNDFLRRLWSDNIL